MEVDNQMTLIDFYKIVLSEYYKSKQKPSMNEKFEDFRIRCKAKLNELLIELNKDLESDDHESDSDVDSLEAFNQMLDPVVEAVGIKSDLVDLVDPVDPPTMDIDSDSDNSPPSDVQNEFGEYKRELVSNWNKIIFNENFYEKYYKKILKDLNSHTITGGNTGGNIGKHRATWKLTNTQRDLLETLDMLKEDVSHLGIKSPILIGHEIKILQTLGLYDKMWELYRNSPVISLEGYNAILEYYLTLKVESNPQFDHNNDHSGQTVVNNQQLEENNDLNTAVDRNQSPTIPSTRPTTITKRKIWQVVTAIKANSKPDMKTYCLLLDLFSTFYQDKKSCVDIMNKMSASGLDYNRECILSGVLAMARCDMDPSPRLDKLLYKYKDTLKLELGKDVEMMTALLKYWVVRKKPHASFKIFQKAVKYQTRLGIEGINQILEAARLTEDPHQLVVSSIVPYLEMIKSQPDSDSRLQDCKLDHEWIAVIKFLAEVGFAKTNSYGEGVSNEEIANAKDFAKTITDISKNITKIPLDIQQILLYSMGVLHVNPGKISKKDRQILLESFMHGWMDAKGDTLEMEKIVTSIEFTNNDS